MKFETRHWKMGLVNKDVAGPNPLFKFTLGDDVTGGCPGENQAFLGLVELLKDRIVFALPLDLAGDIPYSDAEDEDEI